ncbi:MAG: Uma2 family endonuclease [Planctomycetota bacterium]|nr:Uma2 family endonuclease [Planctomycetota bacterium]
MRAELKITYDDYKTLPEGGPRYQVIEGELVMMTPAPNFGHQKLVWGLGTALYNHVLHHGLGTVVGAPVDLILSETNVFQPDIVFVSRKRKRIIVREGLRGAPDLCVEVLSKSTADQDRDVKRKLYAQFGVLELWLVDPELKQVEVFRLQEDSAAPARVFKARETLKSALLPGFEVELKELFSR